MTSLSFRSSRIIYYGPHPCANCGINIVKAGDEFGGSSFTYPPGPIYPNSEWHPHFCNPKDVYDHKGRKAKELVLHQWPDSGVVAVGNLGYVVLFDFLDPGGSVISANHTFCDSIWGAWNSAWERYTNKWPVWQLDPDLVKRVGTHLMSDPESPETANTPQP